MGSAFHQLCPRYSGTLTPTARTAIRLWETFTFFILLVASQAKIYFPSFSELQIRKGNEDNSKIIFFISRRKHVVTPR